MSHRAVPPPPPVGQSGASTSSSHLRAIPQRVGGRARLRDRSLPARDETPQAAWSERSGDRARSGTGALYPLSD
jgi:hypothetical protein